MVAKVDKVVKVASVVVTREVLKAIPPKVFTIAARLVMFLELKVTFDVAELIDKSVLGEVTLVIEMFV